MKKRRKNTKRASKHSPNHPNHPSLPMADAQFEPPHPIFPPDSLLNLPSHSPLQNPRTPPPSSPPLPPDEAAEATLLPECTISIAVETDALNLPAAAPTDATVSDRPAVIPRMPPAKRKKRPSSKQRAAAEQKVALLTAAFHPIPFSASNAIASVDLNDNEALLRALGLWDFAHLPLDCDIRPDLLIPLIAHYDPPNRRSFVRNLRISVSRADLAHALRLPSKKDKGDFAETGAADPNLELYSRGESAATILDFMSGFMLFQFQGDACILPTEIVTVNRLLKEGQPHKVDWEGLMWLLVEKELLEVPKSGVCLYASHLQCLLKYQHPRLFQEAEFKLEPIPEVEIEAAESADVVSAEEENDAEDDTDDAAATTRIRSLDDLRDASEDKHGPGLSLGLGGDLSMAMTDGFEQFKEGHEEQWFQEKQNRDTEHCLKRCTSSGAGSMEFENLCKTDEGGRGEEGYIDDLSAKYASFDKIPSFDRLTSADLQVMAMGNVNLSYSQPVNSHLSSAEFLAMRNDDVPKNMPAELSPDRSLFAENNGKRQIGDIHDEEEDEDDENTHKNRHKKMRNGTAWERAPTEIDTMLEQIQLLAGKTRMLSAEKEQNQMNTQLQVRYFNEMLQQKNRVIQSLEKTRVEEQQKRHLEVCRYEHEINALANLMIGYQKALKGTRRAFAEYRKKYPQGDEPLYKDVFGSDGLVLTVKESETQRLEKEEEVRNNMKWIINSFEKEWILKLDNFASLLVIQYRRILEIQEKVKLLKGELWHQMVKVKDVCQSSITLR